MAYKYQRRASWQPAKPKKPKSFLGVPGQQNWASPKASGPSTLGGVIGSPPSPTSTAAPGPSAQPLPFDATYNDSIGLNRRSYETSLSEIGYGRQQVASDYGYTYDPAANGGFGAITGLDTSNPYNQATMLQRAYQQSQRAQNTGMASRGQLYSGALQRGLNEGTFQYSRNQDALKRQALGAFDQYRRAEQEAKSGFDQGNIDAFGDWVGRSQGLEPNDPGAATSGQPTPAQVIQQIAAKPKPTVQDSMNFAQSIAHSLWNSGERSGRRWRAVIDTLGYDPRQGGGLKFK